MVSIHRVSVDVLLIISVVCFIFRFKREALHCRSFHGLRAFALPLFYETSNKRKPHAVCIYQQPDYAQSCHWCRGTPMALTQ